MQFRTFFSLTNNAIQNLKTKEKNNVEGNKVNFGHPCILLNKRSAKFDGLSYPRYWLL